MRSALIGYTGFVGSNLLDSRRFDDLYNSKNIASLAGQHYDLVVSAANRADSFRINQDGNSDRAEIVRLVDTIRTANISKLVLISTVCVYPGGGSPDESTSLSTDGLTPYGANRLLQEQLLSESIDTTIVRLPQLVGARLKKGVVYDLANDHRVEHIRPDGKFQHYDVRRLWADIEIALENGLSSLNISTPPISNAQIAAEVFERDIVGQVPAEPESPFAQMYTRNMTTTHFALFGGPSGYLMTAEDELAALRAFARDLLEGRV